MQSSGWLIVGLLAPLVACVGCRGGHAADEDADRRIAWIAEQTKTNKAFSRDFLNRSGDSKYAEIIFYDGWYPAELDPKTGHAWRWSSRHGVVRLRTKLNGDREAHDMELKLTGWVPHEHMSVKVLRLELAVNGHVLDEFDPPAEIFEHRVLVPRRLLAHSEWVDFTITAANVAVAPGDWRELGFGTTGFQWARAPEN